MGTLTRPSLRRCALATIAAGGMVAAAVVNAPGAGAATGTFVQPGNITINDATAAGPAAADPYPSNLAVSGLPNGITDVNVTLKSFDHTYPDDVDVMLVGPGGHRVMLMSDVGENNVAANLDLTLDDEAAASLPDATALAAGVFKPTNFEKPDPFPTPVPDPAGAADALSAFDGTNPNGTWRLYVADDDSLDTGDISGGWSLQITTADPPAVPVITSPAPDSADGDGSISFSGTAPAGTTVRVLEGGVERASTATGGTGVWNVTLTGVPDGAHTYTATATDTYNTSPSSAGVNVTVDTVAPGGTILINGGAALTNRTLLTLTLAAADSAPSSGVTQMRFSDDGTNFTAYEPLAATKSWTLPTGTNGTRTVWAQFADRAGHVSAPVADSIILDTVKPRVSKIKPLKGATGVNVSVNVRAFFSEAMAAGTMTKANVKLVKAGTTKTIKATISYDSAKRKVTINPKKNLKHGTTYKVTIGTGVKDLAGNNLDQKPNKSGNQPMKWKFTTS